MSDENDALYQNSNMQRALDKSEARSKRAKWIALGSVVGLVVIIGLAVGLGVGLTRNKSSSSSSSSSSSTGGSSSGGAVQTDPNDPSSFEKDPNLHKAFYGLAYTPDGAIMPDCGAELSAVIKDMQLMSQVTNRIRLYGSDCNQSALVLEAIKQTKVDVKLFLGNYPDITDDSVYTRQRDAIKEAIQTYGTDHIEGITVGNEVILNAVTDANTDDPNGSAGNAAGEKLVAWIKDTKSMLSDLGVDIPVGNSDAAYYFNKLVMADMDYGLANDHPWFAGVSIDEAAQWTFDSFDEQNVQPAAALPNKPKMYIAETGWPTNSVDKDTETNSGGAEASVANLQTFLDTFVCKANQDGVGYFYFEFKDEKWKELQFGGVEGAWGIWNGDRTLKDIKIPTCVAP